MSRSFRLHSSLLFAATFALGLLTAARAEDGVTALKFSDPTKPGTLKIVVGRGDIQIKGDDTAEVSVKSDAKPLTKKPRKDGLRVLTASTTFAFNEKDNVVTLDALSDGWGGAPADFHLVVPHNTNVTIVSSYGGDITCTGVTGDLDIKSMSGEIRLDDINGGALVETMNGEIRAGIRSLHDGKPLSFTSMNGEVVLRAPSDAKANLRLRTQNGSILTDFDDKALVTKTENIARSGSSRRAPRASSGPGGDIITSETRDAIREAARASAQAMRDAAQAMRDAAQAARDGAQAAHDGATGATEATAPVPPVPPMPPIPPVTGGKLVTGVLNGGGPEISVATMNGDVTLRQFEAKK